MITNVDNIINKLRKHANNGKQNENIVVSKISLVRIVDYIDKLERATDKIESLQKDLNDYKKAYNNIMQNINLNG